MRLSLIYSPTTLTRHLRARVKLWRNRRFLKKHGCRSWRHYAYVYDKDYIPRATCIKNYYNGYKYIHCFENHNGYAYKTVHDYGPGGYKDGGGLIADWCEENLKHKWRCDGLRAMKAPSTGNEWEINELGGYDYYFFAFQDQEDYFLFKLYWGN